MRLSKFISTSGYASRREADVLIQKGTVIVNNSICTDFSTEVTNEDEVIVENTLLTLSSPRLWMINKPKGFLCTSKDPMGRKTIYELIPDRIPRVISVGRLDLNSEGLLLLTNNGELSRFFELPKNKVERCYLVEILGSLNSKKISLLEKGLNVGGLNYGPIKVKVRKKTKQKFTLELKLQEGKNREIRNIASYFDWKVIRLKRTKYGDYTLGNLKERELVEVKIPELFTYSTR
ncbi:MAG: pseudouridine synthase [Dehalococcoidia bacterium]|nr:pseudouridine synthase [Dehalococcoidia bacterium]